MKVLTDAETEFIISETEKDKVIKNKKTPPISRINSRAEYFENRILAHDEAKGYHDI